MDRIPLVNISLQHETIRNELLDAVERCLNTNKFVGGHEVDRFAKAFAEFGGGGCVATCGNGTDALYLALSEILGPGGRNEEIITTPLTFAATAEAIVLAGYKPVFVDIDPATCLMDLSAMENAITPTTRAILPVHLYGQMLDIERVKDISKRNKLAVIEDAAQAHGAQWKSIPPGALSDAACYSFYPGKNLGAWGDGGAVHTWNQKLAVNIRRKADHGRTSKYVHEEIGTNSRLDSLQAAILRVKLKHLKTWNSERQTAATIYDQLLAEVEDVTPLQKNPHAHHVYHLYVVKVDNRDAVMEILQKNGIDTGIHYPIPLHQQPALASFCTGCETHPMAEDAAKKILSLPIYPGITTEQIKHVVATLKKSVYMTRLKTSA